MKTRIIKIEDDGFYVERGGLVLDGWHDTHESALRSAFYTHAWPGGYPVGWLTTDGDVLCGDCARKEWTADNDLSFHPFIVEDEPDGLICDECNTYIAYPDEVEDPTEVTIAEYVNGDEDFEVIAFRLPGGA